jgi:hypothetical protein
LFVLKNDFGFFSKELKGVISLDRKAVIGNCTDEHLQINKSQFVGKQNWL